MARRVVVASFVEEAYLLNAWMALPVTSVSLHCCFLLLQMFWYNKCAVGLLGGR